MFLIMKEFKVSDNAPGKLYGSSAPGYIGKLKASLDFIEKLGIHTIFCFDDTKGLAAVRQQKWCSRGQRYQYVTKIRDQSIIVDDFDAPTVTQLYRVTQAVEDKLSCGENVLLHCRGGLGRTGTFLAAMHIKSKHVNSIEAIELVRDRYHCAAIEVRPQEEVLHFFEHCLEATSIICSQDSAEDEFELLKLFENNPEFPELVIQLKQYPAHDFQVAWQSLKSHYKPKQNAERAAVAMANFATSAVAGHPKNNSFDTYMRFD